MQHCPYLAGLFNHIPQSSELGLTFTGAYLLTEGVFFGNVVPKALRVVNPDTLLRIYDLATLAVFPQARDFSHGLLTGWVLLFSFIMRSRQSFRRR